MDNEPIRIFVGCAANHEDIESQAVLEFSIRLHTRRPVDITWMKLTNDPDSPFGGWDHSRWATPFSAFRWIVPELCGYQGRAIYMDSDFIVLSDIGELWDAPMDPGRIVIAKSHSRLCCSLWDCEAAKPYTIPIDNLKRRSDNHATMKMIKRPAQPFGSLGDWNVLDLEDYPDIRTNPCPEVKAIHYTSIPTQLHFPLAIPRLAEQGRTHWFDGEPRPHPRTDLQELFNNYLHGAIESGYEPERYTADPIYGSYRKRSMAGMKEATWMMRV